MKPAGYFVCAALLAAVACSRSKPTPTTADTPPAPAPDTTPAAPTQAAPAPAAADVKDKARALVQALSRGDYQAAGKDFDAKMQKAAPAAVLAAIWQDLTGKFGAFKELRGVRATKILGRDAVIVSCHFEREDRDIQVAFNLAGQVAGLHHMPPRKAPPYARPDAYDETDVVVESGEWKMPGTLTLPRGAGPFPAVVLVHGSGPNDRNETIGPNLPFCDLAWGLATQGVAVLRYDKRTYVHGLRMVLSKAPITLKEETVDDAVAAAALLRQQQAVDAKKVFVLGHSLGAVAGPRIGAADPQLAGLILMAGNTRPLEDVLIEQFSYIYSLKGPLTDDERKKIDELKQQAARVKDPALTPQTPAAQLPLGLPAAYWLDLRDYDPAASAAKLAQPLLILQGGRDYQVTMADFEGWKKALAGRPNVHLKSYPNLNHLFMPGQNKATPEEYMAVANNVAQEVIDDVAVWIKGH
jgi:dienelactone hydrolase